MSERVQISATVTEPLRQRLQHAAIDTGRTQSDLVTEALTEYLAKINK